MYELIHLNKQDSFYHLRIKINRGFCLALQKLPPYLLKYVETSNFNFFVFVVHEDELGVRPQLGRAAAYIMAFSFVSYVLTEYKPKRN